MNSGLTRLVATNERLANWLARQQTLTGSRLAAHGDNPRWQAALATLRRFSSADIDLTTAAIRVGRDDHLSPAERATLAAALQDLHPWRKGPFRLFGTILDSEWRSDLKWSRIAPHIAALDGRDVLDVGCGNGYYMLRLLGAGAHSVLGIDPTLLFHIQFQAITGLIATPLPLASIPVGIDDMPDGLACFDSVFSMGVIYHRRDPLAHLRKLRGCLREGGELILESLVIAGDGDGILAPGGRYAKMRNVWSIPTIATLQQWLMQSGFTAARCVDVALTTTAEQRRTAWMRFESLADFLDPADPSRTVEGHPAPLRACLLANAG